MLTAISMLDGSFVSAPSIVFADDEPGVSIAVEEMDESELTEPNNETYRNGKKRKKRYLYGGFYYRACNTAVQWEFYSF